jgi:hypothetical protein
VGARLCAPTAAASTLLKVETKQKEASKHHFERAGHNQWRFWRKFSLLQV